MWCLPGSELCLERWTQSSNQPGAAMKTNNVRPTIIISPRHAPMRIGKGISNLHPCRCIFLKRGLTHVRIKGQNLNFYLETHVSTHNIYIIRLRIFAPDSWYIILACGWPFKELLQNMASTPIVRVSAFGSEFLTKFWPLASRFLSPGSLMAWTQELQSVEPSGCDKGNRLGDGSELVDGI